MEFGTVKFFDGRNDKRYGFLIADRDGAKVFFHINNQSFASVRNDGDDPIWRDDGLHAACNPPQFPRKGERIIFEREVAPKGPKAAKWSNDYYPYHHFGRLGEIVMMTVEWDILVVTFAKKQFPADSLFGTMEDRVRELLKMGGYGGTFSREQTGVRYNSEFRCDNWNDEQRIFRFELGRNFDARRFTELSIGRGIVEDIALDPLDHARHARRWELPVTATLDEIIAAHRNYIDDLIT